MLADEYQQKLGKEVEKRHLYFFILTPLKLRRINLETALLKEKGNSFLPVLVLINIIQPLQRKMLFHSAPASVPFNHIFFSSFLCFSFY
jgi:hypothetical protein